MTLTCGIYNTGICNTHNYKKKDRAEVAMALYICTFSIFYTKCYYVTMLIMKSIYCWLVINSQPLRKKMQISTTKKPINLKHSNNF